MDEAEIYDLLLDLERFIAARLSDGAFAVGSFEYRDAVSTLDRLRSALGKLHSRVPIDPPTAG